MPRSKKKKPRLKDSSKSVEDGSSNDDNLLQAKQRSMIEKAISSAKKHGIDLSPGRLNEARGNCAFESAIFNVNDRKCFKEKYCLAPNYYRQIWVTDMKNRTLTDETWKIYSDKEWEAGWQEMLESGVYERGIFGDLMLFGICCGLKKILLIFNTSLDSPHDPIYVCDPRKFGVIPDTNIPVVLAYNMYHYESLHPSNDTDTEKTVNLVQQYLEGEYTFKKKDLPFLLTSDYADHQSRTSLEPNIKDQDSLPDHLRGRRPSEMNKEERNEYNYHRKKFKKEKDHKVTVSMFGETPKYCVIVDLDEEVKVPQEPFQSQIDDELATTAPSKNIRIKRKDMTTEQKREYMRIKKVESKNKESEKSVTQRRESERIAKANRRKLETEDEASQRQESERIAKANRRKLETEDEASQRQKSDRIAKANRRKLETEDETLQRQETDRITKANRRKLETKDESLQRQESDRIATATKRKLETEEEQAKRQESNRKAKAAAKAMPKSIYSARNAQKILFGEQIVPELKDNEKDDIERMDQLCCYCDARKWKSETSTVCCTNGKVHLSPFPDPPVYLKHLWTADTIEARLFREESRSFNNALALSSIKVTHRRFDNGYSPSVIFEGKVS